MKKSRLITAIITTLKILLLFLSICSCNSFNGALSIERTILVQSVLLVITIVFCAGELNNPKRRCTEGVICIAGYLLLQCAIWLNSKLDSKTEIIILAIYIIIFYFYWLNEWLLYKQNLRTEKLAKYFVLLQITILVIGTGLFFREQNISRAQCDRINVLNQKLSQSETLVERMTAIPRIDNVELRAKNLILFIGDGMGRKHLESAKDYLGTDLLAMESLVVQGEMSTFSLDPRFPTDSAASATAMATGYKTYNGRIGKTCYGEDAKNIIEYLKENNMAVGVVCTDYFWGATPAAFTSHSDSRNNYQEIFKQQIESPINIFIAQYDAEQISDYSVPRIDEVIFSQYESLSDAESMKNYIDDNRKLYLYFENYADSDDVQLASLTDMAVKYLQGLVNKYPELYKGYFLLVEGSHIDKFSSKNNLEQTIKEVIFFDKAVGIANEICNKKNTALFVTADHECGGLQKQEDYYRFTTTEHTDINVPYFSSDDFDDLPDIIDNTNLFDICMELIE